MALPDNVASTRAVTAAMLPPDDLTTDPLEDWEQGPIAINDVTAGLQARRWRLFVTGDEVSLQPDGGDAQLVFTQAGITRVALAFDQSGRPTVGYQIGTAGNLRWFDTQVNAFVTTSLGALRDLNLTLDDKRASQLTASDIIVAYLRDGGCYYRQQRDRYGVERLLKAGLLSTTRLVRVGMNAVNRLQFDLL